MIEMTSTCAIEPMRWWHVDEVADLERELFPHDRWSAEQFWAELAQPTRTYWIARDASGVIGYAGLFALPPDGDVQTIAVAGRAQGHGVGRRLLERLLDQARDLGCSSVLLEVRAGNVAALRLYESCGFAQISVRRRYYPDGEDALILQWQAGLG